MSLFSNPLIRTLVPAFAGFAAYGGWAYFCNAMHGWKMGLQSGFVQGSFSFVITLAYSGLMEWMYRKTAHRAFTTILCIILLVSFSYLVNFIAGTPEILTTIAPGAIFGSIYVFGYVTKLAQDLEE